MTLVNEPLKITWVKTDIPGQSVFVEAGRVDCDLPGLLRYHIHPTQI